MIVHDDIEQGSDEWHLLRAGIPTTSEFSSIITSRGKPSDSLKEYALVLAAEKYAGKAMRSFQGNYHTKRGNELEPEARIEYAFTHNREVTQTGFITDDLKRWGCSPDGLVGADGLGEIKCTDAKEHVRTIIFFNEHGRPPNKYYPQVQGQLFITGRQWCDMIFYHPDLPMVVARVEPDKLFMTMLESQLRAVEAQRNIYLHHINKAGEL